MADLIFVKTEGTVTNIREECENVDVEEEDPLMITSNNEKGNVLDKMPLTTKIQS